MYAKEVRQKYRKQRGYSMSDADEVFVVSEEEAEQKAKKAFRKAEPAVESLDETQQRAMTAYAAYLEAERQLETAYKDQERQAEKGYTDVVAQARKLCEENIAQAKKVYEDSTAHARKVYEESVTQALKTRDEAERKAREARGETMERTWIVFTKARK